MPHIKLLDRSNVVPFIQGEALWIQRRIGKETYGEGYIDSDKERDIWIGRYRERKRNAKREGTERERGIHRERDTEHVVCQS